MATRPLFLKNLDNKIIAAVANHKFKQPLAESACSLQRGFVQGRNFVNNIVELDVDPRVNGMNPELFLPCTAFFDCGAAFPSVVC